MSNGLALYSSAGALAFDTNVRLARFHSYFAVWVPIGTIVTQQIAGFVNDGTWTVSIRSDLTGGCSINVDTTGLVTFNGTYARYSLYIYMTVLRY
jgi:hypothetical protein